LVKKVTPLNATELKVKNYVSKYLRKNYTYKEIKVALLASDIDPKVIKKMIKLSKKEGAPPVYKRKLPWSIVGTILLLAILLFILWPRVDDIECYDDVDCDFGFECIEGLCVDLDEVLEEETEEDVDGEGISYLDCGDGFCHEDEVDCWEDCGCETDDDCPEDYECEDEVCVEETSGGGGGAGDSGAGDGGDATTEDVCSDSDFGRDYENFGSVTQSSITYNDRCCQDSSVSYCQGYEDTEVLAEWFCNESDEYPPTYELYTCDVCYDDECVDENEISCDTEFTLIYGGYVTYLGNYIQLRSTSVSVSTNETYANFWVDTSSKIIYEGETEEVNGLEITFVSNSSSEEVNVIIGCEEIEVMGVGGYRCDDGWDNDGDGLIDYGEDRGCTSIEDDDERVECQDGWDNDGDGLVDMEDDECLSFADNSEGVVETRCNDGWDNDFDGKWDYGSFTWNDPGCDSYDDDSERNDCGDGWDNDGDGKIDMADPDCDDETDVEYGDAEEGYWEVAPLYPDEEDETPVYDYEVDIAERAPEEISPEYIEVKPLERFFDFIWEVPKETFKY